MQDAPSNSKSHLKLLRNLIALFVLLWLTGAHWYFDIHLYSRSSYQQVIDDARIMTTQTSETVHFSGDWLFDPLAKPGATNICARQAKAQGLVVRILIYDAHEAGKFGYVYSERSFESREALEQEILRNGCGEWKVSKGLLGPWWVIEGV